MHDDADCCWTISDQKFPLFNSVMRARVDGDRAEALIDTRMQACIDRDVPILWWTGPSTAPTDFGERLLRRGFFIEPAFGMVAALDGAGGQPADDDSAAISRVSDVSALAAWSRVLCESFAAPQAFGRAFSEMTVALGLDAAAPFRHYLARIDGEPVGTCSLFLGAGVAGIYDVSTLPEHRRRGIGAAITRFAMDDARAAGFQTAILHASTLGAGMYRSLGFERLCDIGQYVWVPERLSK